MPVTGEQRAHRALFEETLTNLTAAGALGSTADKAVIRARVLAQFTRALDAKLANLQEGEHLVTLWDVQIVGPNGRVRGGSGSERNMPEYIAWRNAVFARDGYQCQQCGSRENLNAHHIETWQSRPDLRFEVANGVTLCRACHANEHPHLRVITSRGGENGRPADAADA